MKKLMLLGSVALSVSAGALTAADSALPQGPEFVQTTKNGQAEAAAAPAEKKEAKKDDKKDHDFKVTARAQIRWAHHGSSETKDRANGPGQLSGIKVQQSTAYSNFKARRLRLGVKGSFKDRYSYVLTVKGENLISGKSGIHEAFLGYKFNGALKATAGSFKIPFQRENLTSSGRLTSLERSAITDTIGHQFDTGAQLSGRVLDKKLYYAAGLFNGNGGFSSGNNGQGDIRLGTKFERTNHSPFYAGRLQFDPLGEYKNGKAMFSSSTLLSIGAAAYYQKNSEEGNHFANGVNPVEDLFSYTADLGVNFKIVNLEAGYSASSAARVKSDMAINGLYGMVAVFVYKRMLQPWVKFQTLTDDEYKDAKGLDSQMYLSGGLNIYPVDKHSVKFQLAYILGLNNDANNDSFGGKDDWFGVQGQINF